MLNRYSQPLQQTGICSDRRCGSFLRSAAAHRFSFPVAHLCQSRLNTGSWFGFQQQCCLAAYSPVGSTARRRHFSATGISTSSISRTWTRRSSSALRSALHSPLVLCGRRTSVAASLGGVSFRFTSGCSQLRFGISTAGMSLGATEASAGFLFRAAQASSLRSHGVGLSALREVVVCVLRSAFGVQCSMFLPPHK